MGREGTERRDIWLAFGFGPHPPRITSLTCPHPPGAACASYPPNTQFHVHSLNCRIRLRGLFLPFEFASLQLLQITLPPLLQLL